MGWASAGGQDQEAVQGRIPQEEAQPQEMLANKEQILDRVQRHAEEYNFILKNCAQGTALALIEEFGLGSMEIIKALTPFPGVGGTGEICGGITGTLIAFGLFFGSDDRLDYEAVNRTIATSQEFIGRFAGELGQIYCGDIIDGVILGHKVNPGESEAAMLSFQRHTTPSRVVVTYTEAWITRA